MDNPKERKPSPTDEDLIAAAYIQAQWQNLKKKKKQRDIKMYDYSYTMCQREPKMNFFQKLFYKIRQMFRK